MILGIVFLTESDLPFWEGLVSFHASGRGTFQVSSFLRHLIYFTAFSQQWEILHYQISKVAINIHEIKIHSPLLWVKCMHGLWETFFPHFSLQGCIYSIVAGCLASDETGITDLQCRFLKGNEGSGCLRELRKAVCGVRAGICTPGPSIFPLSIMSIYFYSGKVYSDIKHKVSLCASYCS